KREFCTRTNASFRRSNRQIGQKPRQSVNSYFDRSRHLRSTANPQAQCLSRRYLQMGPAGAFLANTSGFEPEITFETARFRSNAPGSPLFDYQEPNLTFLED
ncbi:MAG: hypothetical protein KDE50_32730, partial [Caldilineaceae bacterium]|nr:hypothetical protein [Caldilineaceae bacterium]